MSYVYQQKNKVNAFSDPEIVVAKFGKSFGSVFRSLRKAIARKVCEDCLAVHVKVDDLLCLSGCLGHSCKLFIPA